ncbi:MAG: tyrosine-protein phosphatase, partial [Actinomycetota bacterium]
MEGEPGEQRRWVPATGVVNARDLGGLPIVGGGSTSFGQLFRSARLSELDAAGRTAIEALDLVEIIDLRRNDERAAHPGPYSTAHLGLVGQPSLFDADVASLRTRADGERWLLDDYLGMLTTGAGQVGAIVRRIAHAGGPVLFHCTGGKDRTGIVAAIVLSAVGVQREVVLDDFELTNRRRGPEHLPDVVAAFVEHGIG